MTSKSEHNNQLSSVSDYDVKRMVFSAPQQNQVPNTNPPIYYKRINVSTLNKDGSIGDLILPTEEIFSFGVSENINPETKKVNGHVLPLCLWNRDSPSQAEKAWSDGFNRIVENCKKHLMENKEEIEKYDLEDNDLKKFNPLYWKKEKGKIVEGQGPTLYTKLIASKKHDKILSMFFNQNGETLDPLSLLGKYCYVKAAVKVESIYVGNKITLQVKLYEAEIKLMDNGMKPLISKPKNSGKILNSVNKTEQKELTYDEGGSLNNSDNDEEEEKPKVEKPTVPTEPKPAVRRIAKKVVASTKP